MGRDAATKANVGGQTGAGGNALPLGAKTPGRARKTALSAVFFGDPRVDTTAFAFEEAAKTDALPAFAEGGLATGFPARTTVFGAFFEVDADPLAWHVFGVWAGDVALPCLAPFPPKANLATYATVLRV